MKPKKQTPKAHLVRLYPKHEAIIKKGRIFHNLEKSKADIVRDALEHYNVTVLK